MALKDILQEISKLSPEDQKGLKQFFGGEKTEVEQKKEKNPPEAPKSGRVYFFKQFLVTGNVEITGEGENRVIKVDQLPDRVIAVDYKQAWRLYWKNRGKFQFLGSSEGRIWRQARIDGKSVSESQALEYAEMLKAPDMTPPMNREKTVFRGTKIASVARGDEVEWQTGMKQQGGA